MGSEVYKFQTKTFDTPVYSLTHPTLDSCFNLQFKSEHCIISQKKNQTDLRSNLTSLKVKCTYRQNGVIF